MNCTQFHTSNYCDINVIFILFQFDDKKTYSQVEFDEIRGEWITFML